MTTDEEDKLLIEETEGLVEKLNSAIFSLAKKDIECRVVTIDCTAMLDNVSTRIVVVESYKKVIRRTRVNVKKP